MLNCDPQLQPSWNSERHQKHTFGKDPSRPSIPSFSFDHHSCFQKNNVQMYFPSDSMLNYVPQWRPSWISDRHQNHGFGKEPSNDHSYICKASNISVVSKKMIFKCISKGTSWNSNLHQKHSFTKGPSNDHSWTCLASSAFPIGSNAKLSSMVVAILEFRLAPKTWFW